jgi:hypothetical protein
MIYDIWIRVIYFLSLHDLSNLRQSNRFIHQCVENDFEKSFSWYKFKKQLNNLAEISIPQELRLSNELHFPEKGCTFLLVKLNNEPFLKISDYLGKSKYVKFCDKGNFCFDGDQIFQIYLSRYNLIVVEQFHNKQHCIFDINLFQFINLYEIVDIEPLIYQNYARLVRCFDRPHKSVSYPRERQFHFSNCSVTLRFKNNYLYCKKFSLFFQKADEQTRNKCYIFHTGAINHWIFTYFDVNVVIFFHVTYYEYNNSFKCAIVDVSHSPTNVSFVCRYFYHSESIAIIQILSDLRWRIIGEVILY